MIKAIKHFLLTWHKHIVESVTGWKQIGITAGRAGRGDANWNQGSIA